MKISEMNFDWLINDDNIRNEVWLVNELMIISEVNFVWWMNWWQYHKWNMIGKLTMSSFMKKEVQH